MVANLINFPNKIVVVLGPEWSYGTHPVGNVLEEGRVMVLERTTPTSTKWRDSDGILQVDFASGVGIAITGLEGTIGWAIGPAVSIDYTFLNGWNAPASPSDLLFLQGPAYGNYGLFTGSMIYQMHRVFSLMMDYDDYFSSSSSSSPSSSSSSSSGNSSSSSSVGPSSSSSSMLSSSSSSIDPTDYSVGVYHLSDGGTTLIQTLSSPAGEDIQFGCSVAISERHLAVGACKSNDMGGSVFVYTKDLVGQEVEYIQTTEIKASDISNGLLYGASVALNEHSMMVGSATGHVYYNRIPVLVSDVEFVFYTKDDQEHSIPAEMDLHLLNSPVDFDTITYNDSGMIDEGQWIGSTVKIDPEKTRWTISKINLLKVDREFNGLNFLQMALGDMVNHGFVLKCRNFNEAEYPTSFYSADEELQPQWTPELNIQLKVYPTPVD